MERWKVFAVFTEKPMFWLAIAGAILLKMMTTKTFSLTQLIVTAFSAVFFAVIFTHPILAWTGWPPGVYEPAVAAVLALFGEHIARLILQSESIADLIRAWKGK